MAQKSQSGVTVESPVHRITGVWKFTREPGGYHQARSLPGHLLHLVTKGSYRLRTNAREYGIKTNDVIYYHETEGVEWLGNEEEVMFYSVGFIAPQLDPLPPERRVFASNRKIRSAFGDLYDSSVMDKGKTRDLRLYSALLKIVSEIDWGTQSAHGERESGAQLWRRVERILRERHIFRPTLDWLAAMSGSSRATVVRACRAATGLSPMARLRGERMAEARGLLLYSSLNVSQVAEYLGYGRVHEFSRDFSSFFGHPPTTARKS